jgi:hypothetical protein
VVLRGPRRRRAHDRVAPNVRSVARCRSAVEELLEVAAGSARGAQPFFLDDRRRARGYSRSRPMPSSFRGRWEARRSSAPTAACSPSAAARETPRCRQARGSGIRNQSRLTRGLERLEGRGRPQRRDRRGVLVLEELHEPLRVAETARPSFRCRVRSTPCGRRSFSTRALIRLISRRSCRATCDG